MVLKWTTQTLVKQHLRRFYVLFVFLLTQYDATCVVPEYWVYIAFVLYLFWIIIIMVLMMTGKWVKYAKEKHGIEVEMVADGGLYQDIAKIPKRKTPLQIE